MIQIFNDCIELAEKISNNKWKSATHLQLINQALVDISKRKYHKLMINLPPRHGKSELISKYFPIYYLQQNPDHRIILASYGSQYAHSLGRKIKDTIETNQDTLGMKINKNARSSKEFLIENSQGSITTCGIGGPLTGKGADLLIIDDPIKNDKEANSAVYRERNLEWYNSTAFTRLEPNGIIIFVMTRWREDDLAGQILAHESSQWKVLKLPAIAEEQDMVKEKFIYDQEGTLLETYKCDILGRKLGQALWEERFDIEQLLSIKQTIGSYWFASLYQQSPSPANGGIFQRKYFQYFRIENQEEDKILILSKKDSLGTYETKFVYSSLKIFQSIDLAVSTSNSADFTVILTFALSPQNDIIILDIFRAKIEGAEHINYIHNSFMQFSPLLIGIESTQYQLSLVQMAINRGLPIKALKADKDKVSRSLAIASYLESSKIFFDKNAAYLQDFEKELLLFPNGKHDDMVDAFAYISKLIAPVTSLSPSSSNNNKEFLIRRGLLSGF